MIKPTAGAHAKRPVGSLEFIAQLKSFAPFLVIDFIFVIAGQGHAEQGLNSERIGSVMILLIFD